MLTTSARRQTAWAALLVASAFSTAFGQADPAIAYVAKYASKGKSYWDVTVMNADGTNRRVIWSRQNWTWELAWSPDLDGYAANGYGGTLAITTWEPYPPGGTRLWLLDVVVSGGVAQGTNLRVLADSAIDPFGVYINYPAWSPDLDPIAPGYQGKIAFNGGFYPTAQETYTINLIDMAWDGASVQPVAGPNSSQPIYLGPPATGLGWPTWNPEGTRIAFKQGGLGFLVMDSTSGAVLTTIMGTTSPSGDCDWQRTSGSSVLAIRNADQLHTLDVGLGISSLTPIPGAPCADQSPTWSPDDRYIVFHGRDCGTKKYWTIRRTDTLTGQVTTLAAESGKDLMFPDWRRF